MSKKTTKIIIVSGNDYLIQVKNNQPNLYKVLKDSFIRDTSVVDLHRNEEKIKGRRVTRTVKICTKPKGISPKWQGIKTGIYLNRSTTYKGKISKQDHYYITSLETKDAQKMGEIIRRHWSVENQLHWAKDVVQHEDNANIAPGNGSENLSILKNIAINIVRKKTGAGVN